MSMGHFSNSADPRSGLEVVRDWNGVAQVVLRSPKGHSARVRRFLLSFTDRLGIVSFCEVLMSSLFALQVSLHGGQVVSWKNDRGEELLFTSSKVSRFFSLALHSSVICNVYKEVFFVCD